MPSQMDFFGGGGRPPSGKKRGGVEPQPASPEIEALAARLPRGLHLGTMTWTYPGWIGVVFAEGTPKSRLSELGLPAYCQHPLFNAVELEGTFYAPTTAERLAARAAQTPPHFRFSAKAHQDCTRPEGPRFLDTAYATERVVAPFADGLGDKGGVLVFQFPRLGPEATSGFVGDLHDFLRGLPRGPRYAVELRNPELLTPAYAEALADLGAVHCHNVWEDMPDVRVQQRALGAHAPRTTFIRWLSRPGDTHNSARDRFEPFDRIVEEDPPRRAQIAELARDALARGDDVFVLASNKAEGCAPRTLELLARELASQP